jgi:hypothetical protein
VAEARLYRPNFSYLAEEAILSLPKRRQRKAMDRAYELARYPFIESDFSVVDEDGRVVEHLSVDGFVFSYWVDHAVGIVMIAEIDDAG